MQIRNEIIRFVDYVSSLRQFSPDKDELVQQFINEARNLIEHNEWAIGFENLLDNFYEYNIKIYENGVRLANHIIDKCGYGKERFSYLNDMS